MFVIVDKVVMVYDLAAGNMEFCEILHSLSTSRRVLVVEMTEANSHGMRLSLEAVTPGNRVTRWASCDPGTGTLSPSAGLWYPGGETIHHLMVV